MPSFETEFIASRGRPIEYHGETLCMLDRFPAGDVSRMRVVFESVNAEWRQGICLECDGDFAIDGRLFSKEDKLVFWHDTAPPVVEVELVGNVTEASVYNAWDMGDGTTHAWHNGAAMIVEELPNGRRYRCNDGEADEDFDDIIFRLERVT